MPALPTLLNGEVGYREHRLMKRKLLSSMANEKSPPTELKMIYKNTRLHVINQKLPLLMPRPPRFSGCHSSNDLLVTIRTFKDRKANRQCQSTGSQCSAASHLCTTQYLRFRTRQHTMKKNNKNKLYKHLLKINNKWSRLHLRASAAHNYQATPNQTHSSPSPASPQQEASNVADRTTLTAATKIFFALFWHCWKNWTRMGLSSWKTTARNESPKWISFNETVNVSITIKLL